jgi:hypothetical protein
MDNSATGACMGFALDPNEHLAVRGDSSSYDLNKLAMLCGNVQTYGDLLGRLDMDNFEELWTELDHNYDACEAFAWKWFFPLEQQRAFEFTQHHTINMAFRVFPLLAEDIVQ